MATGLTTTGVAKADDPSATALIAATAIRLTIERTIGTSMLPP
jgi:hypothetical protein